MRGQERRDGPHDGMQDDRAETVARGRKRHRELRRDRQQVRRRDPFAEQGGLESPYLRKG